MDRHSHHHTHQHTPSHTITHHHTPSHTISQRTDGRHKENAAARLHVWHRPLRQQKRCFHVDLKDLVPALLVRLHAVSTSATRPHKPWLPRILTFRVGPNTGFAAAFETRMSMRPNRVTACSISAFRSAAAPTWHVTPDTASPLACISCTVRCTFASLRLLTTTCAPSSPSRCAIARPIPSVDAVTIATRPTSRRAAMPPACRLLHRSPPLEHSDVTLSISTSQSTMIHHHRLPSSIKE
jgi:hypothetical protein